MKKYKISGLTNVMEVKTGHIVYRGADTADAGHRAAHLNKGVAFNGWTPEFFLNKL